jgi:hypothetical protein
LLEPRCGCSDIESERIAFVNQRLLDRKTSPDRHGVLEELPSVLALLPRGRVLDLLRKLGHQRRTQKLRELDEGPAFMELGEAGIVDSGLDVSICTCAAAEDASPRPAAMRIAGSGSRTGSPGAC